MKEAYLAIMHKWGLVRHADGLLYVHLDAAFVQGIARDPGTKLTPPQTLVNEVWDNRVRDAVDELIDAGATDAEIDELTANYIPPTSLPVT